MPTEETTVVFKAYNGDRIKNIQSIAHQLKGYGDQLNICAKDLEKVRDEAFDKGFAEGFRLCLENERRKK